MDNRGQIMALAGVIFFMLMVFIAYVVYSIFAGPTTSLISAVDNTDSENIIPPSILQNITRGAEYWPLVFVIVGFIVMVALIYKRSERVESSYYGGYG